VSPPLVAPYNSGVNLSDLGEFRLIERLTGMLPAEGSPNLIVGIGDDAAVWRAGSEYLIATTDTMVEGVHFVAGQAPWADVGWKALAANVSDIAAMGGTPLFALVTLALPPDMPADDVEVLYAGLAECAREYGVTVAGGDVVRAPQTSITVALIGKAERRDAEPLLLRRDTARPGHVVAVTGTLGDSAAGLRRLREGAPADEPLARRHLWPRPPLAAAGMAAKTGVACGIDVSDGLLQDMGHICEQSGVGAIIRASDIPLSKELRAAYPDDALRLACTGGEDYELVLVADRDILDALSPMIGLVQLTVIGEIVDDPENRVRLLDDAGNEITFEGGGWDAFR
jgi:thiamine-monophosphate kinase